MLEGTKIKFFKQDIIILQKQIKYIDINYHEIWKKLRERITIFFFSK